MQPLGCDGEPPKQPWDEDQDDHTDEERRGDADGVNRITAVISPVRLKNRTERQYIWHG
jgi:hypothetical protein